MNEMDVKEGALESWRNMKQIGCIAMAMVVAAALWLVKQLEWIGPIALAILVCSVFWFITSACAIMYA